MARVHGIQPSEFWEMTMPETLLEFEFRSGNDKSSMGLTPEQDAELRRWIADGYPS